MRIQIIFGVLCIFTQTAMGLLFQDVGICRFTDNNQCHVALGQKLQLQIPLADGFILKMVDLTSAHHRILTYNKNTPKPNLPRWQFVNKYNTMILTSAERNDSGTYILHTIDTEGTVTSIYTLQLYIAAQVSSVSVWYSCLASEDIKLHCSADGDDLTYSWTSDFNPQLENGSSTLTLSKGHHGNVTCYVKNQVSQSQYTTKLQPCSVTSPKKSNHSFMVFVFVWVFEVIILLSVLVGAFCIYTRIDMILFPPCTNGFRAFVCIFVIIILLVLIVMAFCLYKKLKTERTQQGSDMNQHGKGQEVCKPDM
ncbi:hypothetical protein HF521_004878 [Silurus meridionalis]|uniref:Ig-like domain-containing protein n=1 Tax=Silurus meridionalis TaxID=175797 RepID=A0A8T0B125_SILME|nr:hypothetical protein HF521_004878 [Silurus meridionalis]